jgi:hypothetical protein
MPEVNFQVNLEGCEVIDELAKKLKEVQTLIEKINQTPLVITLTVNDNSDMSEEVAQIQK